MTHSSSSCEILLFKYKSLRLWQLPLELTNIRPEPQYRAMAIGQPVTLYRNIEQYLNSIQGSFVVYRF